MAGRDVLTVAQMFAVDARAVELGVSTRVLMENAGRAVAEAFRAAWPGREAAILCGPGNNGGDGYVAARLLAEAGVAVRVFALSAPKSADAAQAAAQWTGAVHPLACDPLEPSAAIIDALFGAGLKRPLGGEAAAIAMMSAGFDVLAVDVPSGLPGDGAAPTGPAVQATRTLTFVRKKPAHLLLPGRSLCGLVEVADIGAPEQAVAEQGARLFENTPALWPKLPRWPSPQSHKHSRGKVAIWAKTGRSRPSATLGAQRLAARAAQRAGAGWVSIFCAPEDAGLFLDPSALVVRSDDDPAMHDAIVFGCGAGRSEETRATTLRLAQSGRALVLDADALSSFESEAQTLFSALSERAVLTPHAGEFKRLFPEALSLSTKVDQARAAAAESGAVLVFKGFDTVIAAPDGRCAINANATPWLASAGTGDVLAGVIAAQLASGADAFEAACCGVWLQAEAGQAVGPGLIADDLIEALPGVLRSLCG